ncbi:MAG: hypothetical protein A2527_08965 [Candidatus Lambdaproteobacteria bacterium RIFOXYD2_FULL_50_16]|uniref:Co-chaperone DjlA N-terminal domain-containing protein n=1 Tax=Candidatus Lambdaproteobacteria bacterium RIFOXYD2_FULL_50_16 TaxID=1817772 RepID=A0A1F6GB29_9PROT|nr:MAG: hypothetical protein A2527_08965 [Candidatus Lambdaproteobacteria bacterium RIFOXYD2_FULL_50_16]
MYIPIDQFTKDQKLWYGRLIASAVKMDGAVSPDEIEFVIHTLHFLDNEQKAIVQLILKSKADIPFNTTPPPGIKRKHLAMIFTELISLMVSDSEIANYEKSFLSEFGVNCGFSKEEIETFTQWAGLAFQTEKKRREILEKF